MWCYFHLNIEIFRAESVLFHDRWMHTKRDIAWWPHDACAGCYRIQSNWRSNRLNWMNAQKTVSTEHRNEMNFQEPKLPWISNDVRNGTEQLIHYFRQF